MPLIAACQYLAVGTVGIACLWGSPLGRYTRERERQSNQGFELGHAHAARHSLSLRLFVSEQSNLLSPIGDFIRPVPSNFV
jgi:hypothetical protein